jgi:hypothetical protein
MKSPDNRYEVVTHDYGEIRMGSPEFGRIKIRGVDLNTEGQFGTAIAFSADSRFLAAAELVETLPEPHTRVVVFNLERRKRIVVHDQKPGLIRRFKWSSDGLLSFVVWSHMGGEREYSWQSPAKRRWGLLRKFFGS